jgi:outer membrane protein assembly factor BamB
VLDDYVASLKAGQPLDRAGLLEKHPELASQLDSCLAALDFIHRADQPSGQAPARLGDFRIIREVGRGGMGVVYEAEQLSLKRRVALKVLRFGGAADSEALARFQREAETVARLHHTNIVPVFAVGCEQGVHYYAMQFIEGQGLDRARARQGASDTQIALWGVQAAEALAHAHARGVIHRDIKPSNLLLDAEGVVWLTDFGLARRADEVTLTVTGLLLGTPRYMSPEQAAATQRPVDQRSDVYSLGASLYELATGAPVHDGDTPQRLLAQILEAEPVLPSRHRPEMPRDLETILLKCLAKEPERRYPTAQALADDLRRFANGDPIKARRPSLGERAVRWVRRNRRSALLAAGTATAAVLLVVGLLVLNQRIEHWLQGRLFLATDGPTLTAEFMTLDGRPAYPSFTVPTEEPVALPAGDYLLRLRGRGYLDETAQVRLERGFERAFDVSLGEQRLWEPLTLSRCYELAQIDGRNDVMVLDKQGVTRRHGGTGQVIWTADLGEKADPKLAGFRWDWDIHGSPTGRGETDRRPRLLQSAPDLDRDGTADLVWFSQRQAAVLAISGKDGRVLWCWQAAMPKALADQRFTGENASTGVVLGSPAVVADIDGDGTPDLVVTCAQQAPKDGTEPRWVEALSGRTGKSLWRFDVDNQWLAPPGPSVPDAAFWTNTIGVSSSSSMGFSTQPDQLYHKDFMHTAHGVPVPYPAVVGHVVQQPIIVLLAGTRLVALDPRTGKTLGPPHDLGFWPLRTPQLASLTGAGNPQLLLVGPAPDTKPGADNPAGIPGIRHPSGDDKLTLTAVALDTGKALWSQPLRGYWGWNWFQHPFDWPVLADLDGDGRPEIIVPTGDFAGQMKWSGVEVRDGATGTIRWRKKLSRSTLFGELQQVNRILVGPDVDGDGVRDIFTAVLDGQEYSVDRPFTSIRVLNFDKDYTKPVLRIDALSGKDGSILWSAVEAVRHGSLVNVPRPSVGPLHWWHAGADGWPQLVVPYEHEPHAHYLFSAGTGRRLHLSSDLRDVQVADLDGDGVPELISFRPDRGDVFDRGGQLVAVRGRSSEAWRRLGGYWKLISDLDGDGIPDLLSVPPPDQRTWEDKPRRRDAAARTQDATDRPRTRAISGRDGRILWQAEITDGKPVANWQTSRYQRIVPAGVDLDGDGIPDLLATGTANTMHMTSKDYLFSPLVAVSGRTGRHLWAADMQVSLWIGPQLLACGDLDGDGRPEVLFVSASDWDVPDAARAGVNSNDWRYWLAVLDGATGRIKWKRPLAERNTSNVNSNPAASFSYAVTDLDGDGSPDIVIEGGLPARDGDIHAFRGRDGEPLWTWTPPLRKHDDGPFVPKRPTLTVGELGGRRVVVVLHCTVTADAKGTQLPVAEVVALDARTGQPLWSWQHVVDGEFNSTRNGAVRIRVVPHLVNFGGGQRGVCVWTSDYNRAELVLLDEQGRQLCTRGVDFRLDERNRQQKRLHPQIIYSPVYSPHFRVWCHDLDGDGRDELVVLTNDRLQVLAGDLTAVRWEWPLPDVACDVLDVFPAGADGAATLVVRAGDRVVGLSGRDGRLLWSCSGSGRPVAVLPAGIGELPSVVFDLGDQATVCRRAQPVADPNAARGFIAYTPPEIDDARSVRPLPWNAIVERPALVPSSPWGIALTFAVLAAAVIVIPLWLWRQALRGRSWRLALVPLVWIALVWAGITILYLVELNDDASFRVSQGGWWGFIGDLGWQAIKLAPFGLPLVAFVAAIVHCIRRRSWAWLVTMVLVVTVLAGVAAWVWLSQASLDDDQRFSRQGWAGILPAGVYGAGIAILAWWLLGHLVRLLTRLVRKPWRRPAVARAG